MVAVPAATPVTIPVLLPIVATLVEELVQIPPLVASVSVIVAPTQTSVGPPIAAGLGLTVTARTAKQPVDKV